MMSTFDKLYDIMNIRYYAQPVGIDRRCCTIYNNCKLTYVACDVPSYDVIHLLRCYPYQQKIWTEKKNLRNMENFDYKLQNQHLPLSLQRRNYVSSKSKITSINA